MNNKEPCCFADDLNGKCKALTREQCSQFCPFRKTKTELQEGRNKATMRILSLPIERQIAICEKYNFK